MSATVSLGPLYQFPGWVVNKVSIRSNGSTVRISLHLDRRRKGFRCPCCNQRMGKMKKEWGMGEWGEWGQTFILRISLFHESVS